MPFTVCSSTSLPCPALLSVRASFDSCANHSWRSPDPVGTSCFCKGGSPRALLALRAPAAGRDRLQEKICRCKHKPLTIVVAVAVLLEVELRIVVGRRRSSSTDSSTGSSSRNSSSSSSSSSRSGG